MAIVQIFYLYRVNLKFKVNFLFMERLLLCTSSLQGHGGDPQHFDIHKFSNSLTQNTDIDMVRIAKN